MDSTNDPVYEVLSQIRDAVQGSGAFSDRARPPLPPEPSPGAESPAAPAASGGSGAPVPGLVASVAEGARAAIARQRGRESSTDLARAIWDEWARRQVGKETVREAHAEVQAAGNTVEATTSATPIVRRQRSRQSPAAPPAPPEELGKPSPTPVPTPTPTTTGAQPFEVISLGPGQGFTVFDARGQFAGVRTTKSDASALADELRAAQASAAPVPAPAPVPVPAAVGAGRGAPPRPPGPPPVATPPPPPPGGPGNIYGFADSYDLEPHPSDQPTPPLTWQQQAAARRAARNARRSRPRRPIRFGRPSQPARPNPNGAITFVPSAYQGHAQHARHHARAIGAALGRVRASGHRYQRRARQAATFAARGQPGLAGLAQGGARIAAVGNVITALTLYAEAVLNAGQAARAFAEGVHAGNRRLSGYNLAIAQAENELTLHQFGRDVRFARATQQTAVSLTRSIDRMRDSWAGFDQFTQNQTNRVATAAANFSIPVGQTASNLGGLGDRIMDVIDFDGILSVWIPRILGHVATAGFGIFDWWGTSQGGFEDLNQDWIVKLGQAGPVRPARPVP